MKDTTDELQADFRIVGGDSGSDYAYATLKFGINVTGQDGAILDAADGPMPQTK